jgi:acetylornithine deacetylase/succinyl-diaminopimelate desuccinylase-like protein
VSVRRAAALRAGWLCWLPLAALAAGERPDDGLAHDIFKQLIEINTTDSVGSVTRAAEAMAQRFRAGGFADTDVVVLGSEERKKNVVVRLHGSGTHRPVLLIGHLDVVEAQRADWSTDPFTLVQKDGYFYGRGAQDMKDGDAIMATALLRMKREGFRPNRDIILALTADEEGGCCNGVEWLLSHHRELIDAEFVINHDDLTLTSEHGVPQEMKLTASEKLYADYQLTVTNKGGHSSQPRPDNAINELAGALVRIAGYHFPFEPNNVTRAYFEQLAARGGPRAADMRAALANPPDAAALERLAAEPAFGALLHTTCVATRLEGGHANNALPQRAQANINCRILPGHSQEEIRRQLQQVLADPQVTVRFVADNGQVTDQAPERRARPPPPLLPQVLEPLKRVTAEFWPGVPVIPSMSAGASDGIYTSAAGLPTYCIAGVAVDRDDDREHGRDERVGVAAFYTGNEFFYRFLRTLTAP